MAEDESSTGTDVGEQDWVSIRCTNNVVGRKWHPLIVALLLRRGPLRFSSIKDELDMSSSVLSKTLDDLEGIGLIKRTVHDYNTIHVEYSLTEWGRLLEPVIDEMADWGYMYRRHVAPPTEADE